MSRRTPASARPVYSEPCIYQPDPEAPPAAPGAPRPCTCGLPKAHARHQLPDAPISPDAQQRAAGDRDEAG